MRKLKRTGFKFKPFSIKQKKVLGWWMDSSPFKDMDGIIADGAIRAGKTVSMAFSYVMWAQETFNGANMGLCGKTIGSLRRNVVDPLITMLITEGYVVYDKRNESILVVQSKGKDGEVITNYYYMFGGKDEGSQDLVQGITLGGCLFDEVALMPQSFVNQATGRCSMEGSKLWFNCNPQGPNHFFKKEWIDKAVEKRVVYLHFTMNDNLSLSEAMKERYKRRYSGIFKKRYIDGQWVVADGVIYDMYNPDVHLCKVTEPNRFWDSMYVSCDYGTQNPTTFGLFGVKGKWVHQIRSYYYDGRKAGRQKTDGQYAKDMVDFIGTERYWVKEIIVDPSAASFITELRQRKYELPTVIRAKNDVLDGIRTVQNFLAYGNYTMDHSCTDDITEFGSYVWDEKASQLGIDQPVKDNDHCMDKVRYIIYTKFGAQLDIQYSDAVYAKGMQNTIYKDAVRMRGTNGVV